LQLCRDCFYLALEEEVHQTIIQSNLFSPGERVAVAASGADRAASCMHARFSHHVPCSSLLHHASYVPVVSTTKCDAFVAGGKDSTVLAHILTTLNERHSYGLDLFLLSIDEGITGYRDDSLETVKRNEQQYGIPLKILSYKELYGWTMDEIVHAIGHRNNCTFCGVFRRQALDRGASLMKADKMATGKHLHA
jgi:cytoplasmic tRNA 2-thiolation protein 1